jgi:hypothetical protein
VLEAFRLNQPAVEAVLEASARLAASGSAHQQSMLPVLRPELFTFMHCVEQSRGTSVRGVVSACAGSWQPTLLLTCLKAAAQQLKNGTASPLTVLLDVSRVATLAGTATAQATSSSRAATADQERANLLLLAARTLYVAACALQQLHESPAASAAAAAHPKLQPEDPFMDDNAPMTLRGLAACVTAIGCVLPAAAGGRSTGSTPRHIADVQQLQQRVQQQLEANVFPAFLNLQSGMQRVGGVGAFKALLQELFPAAYAGQLLQLATDVCMQLTAPGPLCCANPGCTNCSRLSERELVSRKGTVCSGCHALRPCSSECNKAYWKAGHKQACSRLKEATGQQQRGGSSSQTSSSSSSRAGAGSRSRR